MLNFPRLTWWPKRVAYLIYLAAAAAVLPSLGLRLGPGLVAVLLPLILVETLLKQLVVKRRLAFERSLSKVIRVGDQQQLLALYRRQHLLRFAAPKHLIFDKLGLIFKHTGQLEPAIWAYEAALDEAPQRESYALAQSLGELYYEHGDRQRAERCYRQADSGETINPGVRARLARLILESDGDPVEAEQLMRQAVEAAKGQPGCGALRCQLVKLLAQLAQLDDARWHLQLAEEELPEDDPSLELARRAIEVS